MLVNKIEPLNEAAKLLTKLREAWSEVATLVVPIFANDAVKVRA
jgi:flagellin-specific chaperone FliS